MCRRFPGGLNDLQCFQQVGVQVRCPLCHQVDHDELIHTMTEFDIGLALERPDDSNYSLTVTNKIFSYFLAGLPVEAKRAEKLLQILLREKNLVRVTADLIFHREALAHLKAQLSAYKKSKGDRITVPVFKDLTGITRKYAIPLLEYLDRERVTRRAGDERVIL